MTPCLCLLVHRAFTHPLERPQHKRPVPIVAAPPAPMQVLYDRFNKSVVIEWAGEDGKTTAYDNTDIGALANNPM